MTLSQQTDIDDANKQKTSKDNSVDSKPDDQTDDLDSLLKEYDSPSDSKDKNKPNAGDDKLKPEDLEYIRQRKELDEQERITKDIQSAVKITKGDGDAPDELVEGFLHHKVSSDARMRKAWEERSTKPDAWNKILQSAGKEFNTKLESYIDARSQSSNKALQSAVHSARQTTPSGGKNYSLGELTRMSAYEFENAKKG